MFETFKNAWKLPDIKKKLLFTLLVIVLYRLGTSIPIPFVNASMLSFASASGTFFQYLNIMTGSAFAQATLFALGINPYITASIVMQLLCIAIPALERISKEGDAGQKKINAITRYVTVALALITAIGYYILLKSNGAVTNRGWFAGVVMVTCYCAGSSLVMWLAEKINDNGIGNGISIILFANIVSRVPSFAGTLFNLVTGKFVFTTGKNENLVEYQVDVWLGIVIALIAVAVAVAMIAFIVWMTNSERRIPVQYAKRVVGRKMYGGQSSNLPIKVNMVGVMPIIFASSIVSIFPTIKTFTNPKEGSFWHSFLSFFDSDRIPYVIITFFLLIFFAYFYTSISFNPVEVANNMKQNGGSVPGIRPGRPTAEYISKILRKITLIGAILLAVIDIFPMIVNIASGGNLSELAFGGSSIIIVVGVILETIREIEAQMTMRNYKGFLE